MVKLALFLAMIGHVLCGICDCLLTYSKKGRIDFKCVKDQEKMSVAFEDMPLSYPLISMVMGTFAIALFGFGYLAMSFWMEQFSVLAANIMLISAMLFLVPIVAHHVICGVVEWIYVRLGRANEAREAVLEMQVKTISTMVVGYLGLLVYVVTLFVMIVSDRTDFPVWACVFNTLVIMILLAFTKLPAKGNIAGAIMFLGLFLLMPWNKERLDGPNGTVVGQQVGALGSVAGMAQNEERNRMEPLAPVAVWSKGGGISGETKGWIVTYGGAMYQYDNDDVKSYWPAEGEEFDFVGYLAGKKKPAKQISTKTVDRICECMDGLELEDLENARKMANVGADMIGDGIAFYKDGKAVTVLCDGSDLVLVDLESVMEAVKLLNKEMKIPVYQKLDQIRERVK